ncbi:MAG: VCBS repeat-containing protein [Endomicrobiales bacterium]|nr:VCBS repeat-containing protein [Endomicrobiales bacterium]
MKRSKSSIFKSLLLHLVLLLISASLSQISFAGDSLVPVGSSNVDLFTGAFTYSYPIEVPPGRNGLQPSLQLIYNSHSGNGWFGVGWNLGIPSISRSTKNGIPDYDSSDTFLFNGQELVEVGSQSGFKEYRCKIGSGMRLRYYTATKMWKGWDKSGTVYEFSGLISNGSEYFYWGLTNVVDIKGNYMDFHYKPGTSAIDKINYAGNNNSPTIGSLYEVTFEYENRSDIISSYRTGMNLSVDERLKAIYIKANSILVKKYELNYEENDNLSFIDSITAFGSSGTENYSNEFTYYNTPHANFGHDNSYNITPQIVDSDKRDRGVRFGDVDGDGRVDVIEAFEGSRHIWLNTGTGWESGGSSFPTDFATMYDNQSKNEGVVLIDFNSDGLVDIVRSMDTARSAWRNDGGVWTDVSSQWVCPPQIVDSDHRDRGVRFGDVDGDGRVDIIEAFEGTRNIWLNTGDGWEPDTSRSFPTDFATMYANQSKDEGVRLIDFNSDGLVDIVRSMGAGRNAWVNNGNGWTDVSSQWICYPEVVDTDHRDRGVRFSDVNGDNRVDIIHSFEGDRSVWLNTGDGWQQDATISFPVDLATMYDDQSLSEGVVLVDVNCDMLPDIVFSRDYGRDVWINESGSFNLQQIKNPLSGTVDIVYDTYVQGDTDLPCPMTVVESVTMCDGMGTGVGHEFTTSYEYSNGLFDKSPWDKKEFLGFGKVKTIDGQGTYTTTWFYQDKDWTGNPAPDNVYKGIIFCTTDDDQLVTSINFYSYTETFSGVYIPHISRADNSFDGDPERRSAVEFEYDGFGNLKKSIYLGEVNFNGGLDISIDDNKIEEIEYGYNFDGDNYIQSYPIRSTVWKPGQSSDTKISETKYYYDETYTVHPVKCNLTKIEKWLDDGVDTVTTMEYDVHGNLTDEYDAVWNATSGTNGNHIHTDYDTTYHQFVTAVSNVEGHTESYTYDTTFPWLVKTQTDINGQVTENTYDNFGRITRIIGPGDTPSQPTVHYEYTINTFPTHRIFEARLINHGENDTIGTYTFLDGFGRTYQTRTIAVDGRQIVAGMKEYDIRGLVLKDYLPYAEAYSDSDTANLENKPYVSYEYDSLGRIAKVINPDGTDSFKDYDGWTETLIDENGNKNKYVKDAYGQIEKVHEFNGTQEYITQYDYDTMGNLTNILNSKNDLTLITYDTLGRKESIVDPQMGYWQYGYDENGNLKNQTDSNGQLITMEYDRLNRITYKNYPDGSDVNYEYDSDSPTGHGYCVGRLTKITHSPATPDSGLVNGTIDFEYDRLGRVVKKVRKINVNSAEKTKTTYTEYDALGRDKKLTYPDGDYITYGYDKSSLITVKDSSQMKYAQLGYDFDTNKTGKLQSMSYNNEAVTTNYTYDPQT